MPPTDRPESPLIQLGAALAEDRLDVLLLLIPVFAVGPRDGEAAERFARALAVAMVDDDDAIPRWLARERLRVVPGAFAGGAVELDLVEQVVDARLHAADRQARVAHVRHSDILPAATR